MTMNYLTDRYGEYKFKDIYESKLFWFGLIVKIILASLFASSYLTQLFIPFVDYYVSSGLQNPYLESLEQGRADAFPYPVVMLYILSIPRYLFSFLTSWSNLDGTVLLLSRIPLILADIGILLILSRFARTNITKILIYYWLSPVLIYISYIHGQLDVIPLSILFLSLYFLFKDKYLESSIVLGIAIAAKTHILIVYPIFIIYAIFSKKLNILEIIKCILVPPLVFFFINYPYIFDNSFHVMVFLNETQSRIFDFNYALDATNIMYILPATYIFILIIAANLKSLSKDVYIMFLGFSFSITTLMVIPMQGWYYWIIPFFCYFLAISNEKDKVISLILFFSLQISYVIYFMLVETSDYFSLREHANTDSESFFSIYNYLVEKNINANNIVNISYTLMQTLLLANCIYIYKFGITKFSKMKLLSSPYLVGISGDSASGKSTISNALVDIFSSSNSQQINGDDMHRWERNNINWDSLTHLNPKANHLHDEVLLMKDLKDNLSIFRKNYDHDTGHFTKAKKYKPNNIIIYDGLHSFYISQMREIFDLKVFLKPSEELRTKWKIDRDKSKRGYTEKKVLESMQKRYDDSSKFIETQSSHSDVIIEIIKRNNINGMIFNFDNSYYIDSLYFRVIKNKNLQTTHEYIDGDRQLLNLCGEISNKEIDDIAKDLGINTLLERLGINYPKWESNNIGLIQLILMYMILQNVDFINK